VTIVAQREVALDEVVERGVKVKHTHFTIANELVLDRAPNLVHGDVVLLGDVLKLIADRAEDPGEDDGFHVIPGRVVDGRSVGEDVVSEFIALQGEHNLITPTSVACRRRIQNSRDKRANVLYPAGYTWNMAMTVASPPEGGGGGALEEAVVGACCRAAVVASASRAATEACSSLRRRAMAQTQVQASTTFFSVA
jgi:hypothetical protein